MGAIVLLEKIFQRNGAKVCASLGEGGYASVLTVIQLDFPHLEQSLSFLGLPVAFHLIPPSSHTDILCPQEHVSIQVRDSFSIFCAHDLGTIDVMIFCIVLMYLWHPNG